MIRRLLIVAAAALTVACATSAPQTQAADTDKREKDPAFRYGRNPGPSPVGAIPDIILNDALRQRSIKASIDYPTRTGPHPVIIISHGGGGSNRGYPGLAAHWASYGYVVIRPAHNDTATAEKMTVSEWRSRVRDLSAVIDALPALEEQYPELKGKIDASRIGVAGHSRGATTAMMIAGLRTYPGPVSYADRRVKAIAALSPNGPRDMWGVTADSWAELRGPALFMSGSRDMGATPEETPEWRQQAFELSPPGDKWLVMMENVQHSTFTGQLPGIEQQTIMGQPPVLMDPRADPMTARREAERQQGVRARTAGDTQQVIFSRVRALALAFFDLYLKEDAKGREFLEEQDQRPTIEVRKK